MGALEREERERERVRAQTRTQTHSHAQVRWWGCFSLRDLPIVGASEAESSFQVTLLLTDLNQKSEGAEKEKHKLFKFFSSSSQKLSISVERSSKSAKLGGVKNFQPTPSVGTFNLNLLNFWFRCVRRFVAPKKTRKQFSVIFGKKVFSVTRKEKSRTEVTNCLFFFLWDVLVLGPNVWAGPMGCRVVLYIFHL